MTILIFLGVTLAKNIKVVNFESIFSFGALAVLVLDA